MVVVGSPLSSGLAGGIWVILNISSMSTSEYWSYGVHVRFFLEEVSQSVSVILHCVCCVCVCSVCVCSVCV